MRRAPRTALLAFITTLCAATVLPLAAPAPAHAAAIVPASAITNVQAIGLRASGAQSTVYVAGSGGLFRSTAPPYSSWTRMNGTANIVALAPHPTNANDLMYLTAAGGVYRSEDGGATASAVTIIPSPNSPVALLARAGSQPATLYAGGSEDGSTAVIYKSTDDGQTWAQVFKLNDPYGDLGLDTITSLTVDPRDANHAIAGGTVYHGGFTVETVDGGATWHNLGGGPSLEHPDVVALNPTRPTELWASWSVMGQGELRHSLDGGHTWTVVTGLPKNLYVSAIQYDTVSGRVYMAVHAPGQPYALYTTRDGGAWERYNARGASITSPVQIVSAGGYVMTGNAHQPLTILPLVGSGNWPVVAPLAQRRLVAAGLLGRPIAPSRACGAAVCQFFDKGAVQYGGSGGAYNLVSMVPSLLNIGNQRAVGGNASTVTYASLAWLHTRRTPPPAGFHHGTATVAGGTFVPYSPHLVSSPGYVVPTYFWSYMSDPRTAPDGWMRDFGLPLTNAVKATVTKGNLGKRQIVIQAFQSAILTYDPLNPAPFRVERANIGVDYAAWAPGAVR